jgi:DNA end-binding protein Ku
MRQSNWRGYLRLSLVAVPVRAFSAAAKGAEIRLNQLHRQCMSRIRYQKTCPIHGEVSNDEIVSGYEYEKGQYIVVDKEEIAALQGERERSITIDAVVRPGAIDPLYFTEKSYYLAPDGKVAEKPYALMLQALVEEKLEAVGHGVLFGREEMVLIHPVADVLAVTALKYHAEVADSGELKKVSDREFGKGELSLTKTLLHNFAGDDFDLAAFTDRYAEDFAALVRAKAGGKEVVATRASEPPPTINLMDALKRSLKQSSRPAKKRPTRIRASASRRQTG